MINVSIGIYLSRKVGEKFSNFPFSKIFLLVKSKFSSNDAITKKKKLPYCMNFYHLIARKQIGKKEKKFQGN